MIEMKVINVIKKASVILAYAVILEDEVNQRGLAIRVTKAEAFTIAEILRNNPDHQASTYELLVNLFDATHVIIEQIIIEHLFKNVFYGILRLENDGKIHELEVRPSEALNLAVRLNCHVLVSPNIVAEVGFALRRHLQEDVYQKMGYISIV